LYYVYRQALYDERLVVSARSKREALEKAAAGEEDEIVEAMPAGHDGDLDGWLIEAVDRPWPASWGAQLRSRGRRASPAPR
jgi:hypothetical protein